MKKFYILLLLLQITLFANIQKRVESACPKEYRLYQSYISEYLIRMEDDIKSYGCSVIPIYSGIIEAEKFEILDLIEDNSVLIKQLTKLFLINPDLANILFRNGIMKNIMLENSINDVFLENFTYIVKKKLHKKELKQISKNNIYLNYILLPSLYATNPKESIKLYNQLKSSISIKLMPSFGLILSSVGKGYSFKELIENFSTIEKTLSSDAIKTLAEYPQYFAFLLYPKKEDLNLGPVSKKRLKEIQKSIQKETLYLYKTIHEKYRYEKGMNQIEYALLTVENIYPYLLEQYDIAYDDFKALFRKLIDKEYIYLLFVDNKCSNSSRENFAIFGQNNIKNLINLRKKEKRLVNTLIDELKYDINGLISFFYVANLYGDLNVKEWKVFKELLKTFPSTYQNKIAFIQRIEQNGYFRDIVNQNDYDVIINSEYANINPKYAYILLTPYPKKSDNTLFNQILYTKIEDSTLKSALIDLIGKNKDELKTHEFTPTEKFLSGVDNADNLLMAASIISAPFTAGLSLAIVASMAAKTMVKITTKKGIKRSIKLLLLDARQNLKVSKTFLKNPNKYMQTKKREKRVSALKNKVDNVGHSATAISLVGMGALILMGNDFEAKTICKEKE